MSVKMQGFVGLPISGRKTRLTWLVNMDFNGVVPAALVTHLSIAYVGCTTYIRGGAVMHADVELTHKYYSTGTCRCH